MAHRVDQMIRADFAACQEVRDFASYLSIKLGHGRADSLKHGGNSYNMPPRVAGLPSRRYSKTSLKFGADDIKRKSSASLLSWRKAFGPFTIHSRTTEVDYSAQWLISTTRVPKRPLGKRSSLLHRQD
jgi:hypothetical protein